MSLPQVLLVDDSAAIVAFEAAALSGLYSLATAADGVEAIAKIRDLKPVLVLLDLSMPNMDGDEVVKLVRGDRTLDDVAIVIVSTERSRAEDCVRGGANAYLPKPLKADELRATVARVLDEVASKREASSLAVLFVRVGGTELGLALSHIESVALMPATRPLASGPPYLNQMIDYRGKPVAVLDLAVRLGRASECALEDRKLVVVAASDLTIAVSVDEVREPELVSRTSILERGAFGGGDHEPLRETLEAIVKRPTGPVAVLDPSALLSSHSVSRLLAALDRVENTTKESPTLAPTE